MLAGPPGLSPHDREVVMKVCEAEILLLNLHTVHTEPVELASTANMMRKLIEKLEAWSLISTEGGMKANLISSSCFIS